MVIEKFVFKVTNKLVEEVQKWANKTGNTYELTNGRNILIVVKPNGGGNNGNYQVRGTHRRD